MAPRITEKYDYKTQYHSKLLLATDTDSYVVVHLVGGKLDLCLQNPALRAVPFEQACAYAAENLDDLPGESSSVGEDLSCHEVSAKDDTGSHYPFPLLLLMVPRSRGSVLGDFAQVGGTKGGD